VPDAVVIGAGPNGLVAANLNGGGQVVVAGPLDGLAALKAEPPAKARVMPLSVAGAFHTAYMAPAREELEALVGGLRPAEPSRLLLSNADGSAVDSGAEGGERVLELVGHVGGEGFHIVDPLAQRLAHVGNCPGEETDLIAARGQARNVHFS